MSTFTENKVFLLGGNLTRDAELKYTGGGTPVCEFSIAVGRSVKEPDGTYSEATDFFNCKQFGKRAEGVAGFLKKGVKIDVIGELRQDRWQDQGGNNRTAVWVLANNVLLMGGGQRHDQGQDDGQDYQRGDYQLPPPIAPPSAPRYNDQGTEPTRYTPSGIRMSD